VAVKIYLLDRIVAHRRRRVRWLDVIGILLAFMFSASVFAQAQDSSPDELENLVARIALYPDDLIAIILPAATNPLQLVHADRYLANRKSKPDLPVDEKWDDAVKSLLNYPEVVKTMSGDLDWTVALGEAVVEDQSEVLDAIQAFRRKTQAVGNLKSDQKQVVTVEKEVITIVQANPEVIYVPQYNPSTVVVAGGYSSWGYYPAPYPVYYYPYPPGAAFATGLIWGAAIGAAWNGGHYHADYHGGNANINIDRSRTTNIDRSRTGGQRPAGGGGTQWKPNKQPGQVGGSIGRTPSRDTRPGGSDFRSGGARPSTQPGGVGAAGGARDRAGSAGDRAGGVGDRAGGGAASQRDLGGRTGGASPAQRDLGGSRAGGGGSSSAFDRSSSSARQTRMDSSRGASSRASSAGARAGGGARGGGGRGGRR